VYSLMSNRYSYDTLTYIFAAHVSDIIFCKAYKTMAEIAVTSNDQHSHTTRITRMQSRDEKVGVFPRFFP
jgi:hypothetical protein